MAHPSVQSVVLNAPAYVVGSNPAGNVVPPVNRGEPACGNTVGFAEIELNPAGNKRLATVERPFLAPVANCSAVSPSIAPCDCVPDKATCIPSSFNTPLVKFGNEAASAKSD